MDSKNGGNASWSAIHCSLTICGSGHCRKDKELLLGSASPQLWESKFLSRSRERVTTCNLSTTLRMPDHNLLSLVLPAFYEWTGIYKFLFIFFCLTQDGPLITKEKKEGLDGPSLCEIKRKYPRSGRNLWTVKRKRWRLSTSQRSFTVTFFLSFFSLTAPS